MLIPNIHHFRTVLRWKLFNEDVKEYPPENHARGAVLHFLNCSQHGTERETVLKQNTVNKGRCQFSFLSKV